MSETSFARRASPGLALFLLTSIAIIGFVDRIIMNVLVEPIKKDFGLTDTQMGVVNGLAFAALNIVLGLAVARIAERKRRLSLIAFGTLLWSVATALCGLAGSYMQLIIARMGVGVGEAVGLPSVVSTISDYFPPEKRVTALSVHALAPSLGAFLGAAGGSLVAFYWGWQAALMVAAVPGIILATAVHVFVAEPPRGQHDALSAASNDHVPSMWSVISRFWKRPTMRHMLLGAALASMVGFALNTFLASWLARRFGYSLLEAGLVSGLVASLPSALSVFGAGWFADKWGKTNPRFYALIPGITLLVAAPIYILGITRDEPILAITLVGIAGLGQYCYLGPTAGVFQNMMHPRMRVTATAFTGLVYSLIGGGLGPVLVGALSDQTAQMTPDKGIALAWALAGFAIIYLWAAAHYLWAARTIKADLARPLEAE